MGNTWCGASSCTRLPHGHPRVTVILGRIEQRSHTVLCVLGRYILSTLSTLAHECGTAVTARVVVNALID
ncbi:hypothetical protein M404DRAFT_317977 [Pisolithus tinctorius Marx 270]|uniref:Uncharacterized protein n=1 Tax=Pisolithus tinctorius Marx 270 TaxID=870435 RepID=A0A0C3JCL1_PISTI|nr:hypothetical protein M404DRAFT_317977 [Pisolithus tinctorius Marx 270]